MKVYSSNSAGTGGPHGAPDQSPQSVNRKGTRKIAGVSKTRFWIGVLVLIPIMAIFWGFQKHYFRAFTIISVSMEPTLKEDDCVIVKKVRGNLPRRGAIVVFRNPFEDHEILVKRVIGEPGDEIVIRNGFLFVNNHLENAEHLSPILLKVRNFRAEVPENKIFVLGDNRNNSMDSLDFGMIQDNLIIGTVILVYWPPGRIRLIDSDNYVLAHLNA